MRSIRNLTIISIIIVYIVILAGGTVRMTGSGMGCPDWPKCFGYLIPPTDRSDIEWKKNHNYKKNQIIIFNDSLIYANKDFKSIDSIIRENWSNYTKHDYSKFNVYHTWIEYINRLIGAIAGLSVLILFINSLKFIKKKRSITILAFLSLTGILFQAWLGKIVVDSNFKKIHKNFEEKKIKNTIVTLLIDNSGSMRGKPIQTAAICSKIISKTLENCSVKVEVLGFTTKEWKGGKSRDKLAANNMPQKPGRLNDLMHIIYKTPEDALRKIDRNFALMLKDGLLKENIDGESLLWALNRILRRNEERKIIMVISDGAPVDDSTISSNSTNYLENHLKKVIKFIENKTSVEIIAIGIGHNVSKYYKKAVTINDPDQLGGAMVKNFLELFDTKK